VFLWAMGRWSQRVRDPETLEERRIRAAELFHQGVPEAEIARRLGVTPQAIHGWHQAYRRQGPNGLKKRPHTGRPPSLTDQQIKKLAELLRDGATASGYSTDLWTTERVRDLVKHHFHTTYTTVGIWKLLHRMGFTWQRPRTHPRERDEEVIATWLAEEWPQLQKKGDKEGQ
jgi:transposase